MNESKPFAPHQWKSELLVAIEASRKACEIQLRYHGDLHKIRRKSDDSFVSEADVESEEVIKATILQSFPGDSFLGEESGLSLGAGENKRRWIIDPLDGTTNYMRGVPFFSTSLALEVEGQVVLGYVEAPLLHKTFFALRGQGAYLNGKRIGVSSTAKIEDAFLATGISYHNDEVLRETMLILERLVRLSAGVRRAGAAALDLCLVAAGVFDGYWEKGLKPWDMAAGALIVSEAGGKLTTFDGTDQTLLRSDVIASNGLIHPFLLCEVKPCLSKT